ncbi:urease accessory protein UreG [Haloquadratum walsbyi]|jgi:urease accessory protein|uniref:Urease accessory protein UreG n=2 Tax=Haloquadratum walsbyi TaxID=293091 RepID=UREG_HALWD|nr:urease accessory protein UreG [Haloquadratum walsbyi]Q18EB7.1 RecName: Full=Urease accessory protein UreG [Haloquadratum walsbyi DSM 16790]CAJ53716.1 urease accessory protein UreG [Haloquadratum walsbyi DSM 16790]CCC41768.1 urease accessory protein UreG [Haloquadratum walsbyi C23]
MGYRDVAKVGLGGPVGSGKTALVQQLVPRLDDAGYDLGVIANDIMTQEDAQRLQSSFAGQIEKDLIAGVETGACPHTGIREDPSMNLDKIDEFSESHPELDVVLIESGGDNLAATFNPELADYFIFVISVAEGDDIPRKRGPGITQADLLVINKTDLAPHVDVSLEVLQEDAMEVRGDNPTAFTNCKTGEGIDDIMDIIERSVLFA